MENDIEEGIVRKVLQDISEERRAAHTDYKEAARAYEEAVGDANAEPENRESVTAFNEATQDLDSFVKRYESHMPRQAFDARKRLLQKALDEATARHRALQKAVSARLEPLQETANIKAKRVQDLAKEWDAQRRIARAAGIDLQDFWTPENPIALKQGAAHAE